MLPEPFKPRPKLPIKCTSLWFPFTYLPPKKTQKPLLITQKSIISKIIYDTVECQTPVHTHTHKYIAESFSFLPCNYERILFTVIKNDKFRAQKQSRTTQAGKMRQLNGRR